MATWTIEQLDRNTADGGVTCLRSGWAGASWAGAGQLNGSGAVDVEQGRGGVGSRVRR